MKVDKLEEYFFIEISFKSPFVVSLPDEGILRSKSFYILKSEDISDSLYRPQLYSENSADRPPAKLETCAANIVFP